MAPTWTAPLFDRTLTNAERAVSLGPDLQDAIDRIEPIFDPTRLDGADSGSILRVAAGTAYVTDVFGERWRLPDDDPNVNLRVPATALGWSGSGQHACDQFSKTRSHEIGDAELTALSRGDCRRLMERQGHPAAEAAPLPVAAAPTSLPVFASPLPGARMSSEAFWAAQKLRIQAAQARLQRRLGERRAAATRAD